MLRVGVDSSVEEYLSEAVNTLWRTMFIEHAA